MLQPAPFPRRSLLSLFAPLVVCTVIIGCQAKEPEPVPAGPVMISSSAANLSFEGVPDGFTVAKNDELSFELTPVASEGTGKIWVESGPVSVYGIDLVETTNSQKAIFEALPGGAFSGSRKLVTQLGDGYYSRGQFDDENGGRAEEVRVHTVHPVENRLVTLFYRYPAGDDAESSTRIGQLLDLVGRVVATVPEPNESPTEE